MSVDQQNAHDLAEDRETVEANPLELAISSFQKQMENGDFVQAKAFLEDQIRRADPDLSAELEHQRVRLRLDAIAIAVMATCGGLLAVVLAVSLFH